MNINKVTIAGRLGKDPELKATPSGMQVASFVIASSRKWKDKNTGEQKEETEWVNCVAWGKTAEVIAQYFTKGKEIYIEGRLQTRTWDGQDGKKNYRTEVIVNEFQFVGTGTSATGASSSRNDEQRSPEEPSVQVGADEEINPDDIPF